MDLQIPSLLVDIGRHAERYRALLPRAASLVLTLALAVLAARLLWLLVPTPEAARWRPAPAPPPAASHAPDLERLTAAALFGHYEPEAAAANLSAAPDTRLSLKLLGILAFEDGEAASRALISGGSDDDHPYAVGDPVTRGVTIKAIYADRVILARNGQLETLKMDKDAPSVAVSSRPGAAVRAGEDDGGSDEEEAGGPGATESLTALRDQLMQDPSKASDFIRVQPQSTGGKMRGYRVYPGRERSLFNGAGLRPGDLVTSVNGVQLDNPARALQLLNDLSTASSLAVTVERGGQQQTVNIDLN